MVAHRLSTRTSSDSTAETVKDGGLSMSNKHTEWVQKFVAENFKASWEIDLIVALKNEPEKQFSAQQLKELLLCADEFTIRGCLERLIESGMIQRSEDNKYQYRARTLEIDVLVGRLCDLYATNRLSLIRRLYESKANNRE